MTRPSALRTFSPRVTFVSALDPLVVTGPERVVLGRGDDLAVDDQGDDRVGVYEDVLDPLGHLFPGLRVGGDDFVADLHVLDRLLSAVSHEGRGASERAGLRCCDCGVVRSAELPEPAPGRGRRPSNVRYWWG